MVPHVPFFVTQLLEKCVSLLVLLIGYEQHNIIPLYSSTKLRLLQYYFDFVTLHDYNSTACQSGGGPYLLFRLIYIQHNYKCSVI